MPETAKSHTTTALTRRTAILGSAAIASAVAVPSVAVARVPSPEFVAQQRAWQAFSQACDEDVGEEACNALCYAHGDALQTLVDMVNAKAVCTPQDVFELAKAHRDASYDDLGEDWQDSYIGENRCNIEGALVAAVLKMGGVNV